MQEEANSTSNEALCSVSRLLSSQVFSQLTATLPYTAQFVAQERKMQTALITAEAAPLAGFRPLQDGPTLDEVIPGIGDSIEIDPAIIQGQLSDTPAGPQ